MSSLPAAKTGPRAAAHENRFASRYIDALAYRPQGITWHDMWTRLAEAQYRGAIVGPEGSGKTTLLEHLARELAAQGWRVHRMRGSLEGPRLTGTLPTTLAEQDLVIVDSGEAVPLRLWYGLRWRARHAGGLLVTLHRPGRLRTILRTSTTESLVDTLVRELAPDGGDEIRLYARTLFERHSGNVRETLRGLYDWEAGLNR